MTLKKTTEAVQCSDSREEELSMEKYMQKCVLAQQTMVCGDACPPPPGANRTRFNQDGTID